MAPDGPQSGYAYDARPWRSHSSARDEACTRAGCGRPLRSASNAAPPPRSSQVRPSVESSLESCAAASSGAPRRHLQGRLRLRERLPGIAILSEVMSNVNVYTTEPCSFCSRVKGILKAHAVEFSEVNLS